VETKLLLDSSQTLRLKLNQLSRNPTLQSFSFLLLFQSSKNFSHRQVSCNRNSLSFPFNSQSARRSATFVIGEFLINHRISANQSSTLWDACFKFSRGGRAEARGNFSLSLFSFISSVLWLLSLQTLSVFKESLMAL
jgi:hypothetical protein